MQQDDAAPHAEPEPVRPQARAATDEELMIRVQAGDEDALRGLMDRHARPLFALIRWIVFDRTLAESLTQDVFASVFLRAGTFKAGRAFAPWLYSMAKHAAIDQARRHRAERRALRLRGSGWETERRPLDKLENRELQEAARKALMALPEKFRIPLVLCDIEGLPYDRAAAALDCPPKTLSSRLTRARARLRRELERYVNL
jgi:RNA polymerase sigma factor (sigma-70 family)